MNNRYETPYRLQRDGFDEIQVGWERVYELTPLGLMDKVKTLSFVYDKETALSFPEYWKSDREADLPALILNNIFGIVPYYDYKGDMTWVRLINLATNETIYDYPGTEDKLLFVCKDILTDCKRVLREWGKEPYRKFRYGQEWLRDPWHKENYQDAFLRPDVRIYTIIKYNRLTLEGLVSRAYKTIKQIPVKPSFDEPGENTIYRVIRGKIADNLVKQFKKKKPVDLDIEKNDLEKMFEFLFDKDLIIAAFKWLREGTHKDYGVYDYYDHIAEAIVPAS